MGLAAAVGAVAAGAADGAHPGHQRGVLRGPEGRQVRPLLDTPRRGILLRPHGHAAAPRLRAQVQGLLLETTSALILLDRSRCFFQVLFLFFLSDDDHAFRNATGHVWSLLLFGT